jgi:hypothetical protein
MFPTPEITNISRVTNVLGPATIRSHGRIIKTDGKQDRLSRPPFLGQCALNLLFNPLARNRFGRKYEEKLLVCTNCVVDGRPSTGPDLEILRGKPAGCTGRLQISVQTFGECVVLARVANEARVVCDRPIKERTATSNQDLAAVDVLGDDTSAAPEHGPARTTVRIAPVAMRCRALLARRSSIGLAAAALVWAAVNRRGEPRSADSAIVTGCITRRGDRRNGGSSIRLHSRSRPRCSSR